MGNLWRKHGDDRWFGVVLWTFLVVTITFFVIEFWIYLSLAVFRTLSATGSGVVESMIFNNVITMFILMFILHFTTYILVFRNIMNGNHNKYIKFFVVILLFVLIPAYVRSRFFTIIILMGMFIVQSATLIYGTKKTKDRNSKDWLFIAYLVPIIGSILYVCIGRKKHLGRKKEE